MGLCIYIYVNGDLVVTSVSSDEGLLTILERMRDFNDSLLKDI